MRVEYLTEKEVSKITRFALPTLRSHRQEKIGIPFIKAGRAVRYSINDVVNFMESRKVDTNSEAET